jgi:hypothetical protein
VDPIGKTHYPIKAHHIKRLITLRREGVLEDHKDVPEAVRDKLYREEQERQERLGKYKRKGGPIIGSGVPYPPTISSMPCPLILLPKS